MTEQKKTWHDVPMEELVLTAREYPAMQAAIGWNILKHAAACGFRTGAGLLRAIHAHEELLTVLKAIIGECEDGEFASMIPSTLFAIIDEQARPVIAEAEVQAE